MISVRFPGGEEQVQKRKALADYRRAISTARKRRSSRNYSFTRLRSIDGMFGRPQAAIAISISRCSMSTHLRTPSAPSAAERIEIGAADQDGGSPQSDCLNYIGSSTYTAVEWYRDAALYSFNDFRQCFDRGYNGIDHAAAMVRDHESIYACMKTPDCIFGGHHAFSGLPACPQRSEANEDIAM